MPSEQQIRDAVDRFLAQVRQDIDARLESLAAELLQFAREDQATGLVPVERAAGPLAHPVMGAIAYVAAMVAYHAPPVYDLTLRSDLAHVLAHMALAGAGALYWWHLISPARQRLRMGILGPVAYMAATKVGAGLVAIALGFAPELIYESYARLPEFWGLTHLEDQRAAGLLMALEQSLVMGIALVALFMRAMDNAEQADRRAERLAQA